MFIECIDHNMSIFEFPIKVSMKQVRFSFHVDRLYIYLHIHANLIFPETIPLESVEKIIFLFSQVIFNSPKHNYWWCIFIVASVLVIFSEG